jgi:hypothetical protein
MQDPNKKWVTDEYNGYQRYVLMFYCFGEWKDIAVLFQDREGQWVYQLIEDLTRLGWIKGPWMERLSLDFLNWTDATTLEEAKEEVEEAFKDKISEEVGFLTGLLDDFV